MIFLKLTTGCFLVAGNYLNEEGIIFNGLGGFVQLGLMRCLPKERQKIRRLDFPNTKKHIVKMVKICIGG